jgi:KDO2-lipid IV(A) lauroyltransferase
LGKILFHIFVIPILYFISIWPFWLLYGFSNFLFFLVYYVFGYRKKVVIENLRKSFPEKSEKEIIEITRKFYMHFCDVILEFVKLITISKKQFMKHFQFDEKAKELFSHYEKKNQTVVGVLGHCGNWEWGAVAYPVYFSNLLTAVYHPLSDKNFNELVLKTRSRYGASIIPMNQIYSELLRLRNKNIPTVLGLIADQTPPPESAYWIDFLNQDTPVFNGAEKIARKFNYPVLYVPLKKVKRGHYVMSAELITDNPSELPEGKISELHVRALERNIREQPHIWLWSHRRWKHKRK